MGLKLLLNMWKWPFSALCLIVCLLGGALAAEPDNSSSKSGQQRIQIQIQKGVPSHVPLVRVYHIVAYQDRASRMFIVSFRTDRPIQAEVNIFKKRPKRSVRPPLLLATSSEKTAKVDAATKHALVLNQVGPERLVVEKTYLMKIVEVGRGVK